jgi:hypothetical protein
MAKKEAWKGAGLSIDWMNPQEDDFTQIERHVEKMPKTKARLDWLDRFITEIEYQVPQVRE